MNIGQFFWADLTVEKSDEVRKFYSKVIGWEEQAIPMKDGDKEYNDYVMLGEDDHVSAGICNKRGVNSNIPPQWIMYINVENVQESLDVALAEGGKVIQENRKSDGSLNFVILEDPQGAVFGIGKVQ